MKKELFSLRWKLGGSLLLVVLVSVGIMSFLINQNTAAQFQQYIQVGNTAYIQRLVNNLEHYYLQTQSWAGVQEILKASLRTGSERMALVDSSGKVIVDTGGQLTGRTAVIDGNGIPLQVSGKQVGTLYLFLADTGMGSGRGPMGGRWAGNSGLSAPASIQTSEREFLDHTNSYIWIAGLIATAVALILGTLLTRQITRPLRELNTGAKHISEGDLGYRVRVRSGDEIGKLAESFNNMAVKLDNSEQSRRRLVSDVAHELRTPLTVIQGTVDGIEDGVFPPDREHLDTIKEQAALLTHVVNDLRDLSLAESGQLKLDLLPADMADLVRRKINQFEFEAREKNIRLRMEAASPLPEIRVDSRRMEQVISNLLSNAIRHTPDGGQVTVSLKTAEGHAAAGKRSLVVSVADTGEGIPSEHLPHVFDRFYRVGTSRSRSEGGAGLGLAIVKQMVQSHGGQVRVESQPGRGSTFYVTLPYS